MTQFQPAHDEPSVPGRRHNPSMETWNLRDIDCMLEVMKIIEAPDFRIAVWPRRNPDEVGGGPVYQMPYPDYHPVVEKFRELCYETSAYIDPYAVLPEDPSGLDAETGVSGLLSSPGDMESASLNQIRRYLVPVSY